MLMSVLLGSALVFSGCNAMVLFQKPSASQVPAPVGLPKQSVPVKVKPAPAPAKAAVVAQKPAPSKVAVVKSAPKNNQLAPQRLSSGRPDYSLRLVNRTGEEVNIDLNHGKLKLKIKAGAIVDVLADASNNQIPYEATIGNKAYADGVIKVDPGSLCYTVTLRL